MNKSINIGIPSKGRLKKGVLEIFKNKKLNSNIDIVIYKGIDKANLDITMWDYVKGLSDHKAFQIDIKLPAEREIIQECKPQVVDKDKLKE